MSHEITWVESHPTEDLLAIGSGDGGVVGKALVWTVGDRFVEAYRVSASKAPAIHAVAFAGDTLLVGFEDGYFEAWIDSGKDWVAGGELFGAGRLASMAVHPKFGVVVFGGGRGSMVAIRTGKPWDNVNTWRGVPPKPISVNQIAFSPDGSRFVAACSDGAARVFTWLEPDPYGRELGQPFYEQRPKPEWSPAMIVASACFDRVRPLVYTAHFSGSAKGWDMSNHGRKVLSLSFDDGGVPRVTDEDDHTEIGGAASALWEKTLG